MMRFYYPREQPIKNTLNGVYEITSTTTILSGIKEKKIESMEGKNMAEIQSEASKKSKLLRVLQ